MNKVTSALIGLGVISMAGIANNANAAGTVIYLTGSTAARAIIYAAAKATGEIFTDAATVVAGTDANSSNQIVYEGHIGSTLYDISCDFTGSEAGIASVAGQNLTQTLGAPDPQPGTYPLPGVGTLAAFYQWSGTAWNAPAALPAPGGVQQFPDLTMADTSQAVSRTPDSLFPLVDYGVVGYVPFLFMKGYQGTPSTTGWSDLVSVTPQFINTCLSAGGSVHASVATGVATDTDKIFMVGRNFGSGTRVNTLINTFYGITTSVTQYAYGTGAQLYPAGANAGILQTVVGTFGSGQTLTKVNNDGFDSGSGVQKTLQVDSTGTKLLVGYIGIADAQNAILHTAGGGAPTDLQYEGVYESDNAVEKGQYAFYGIEHLMGSISQSPSSSAGVVALGFTGDSTGNGIVNGLAAETAAHDGSATGTFHTNPSGQSLLIGADKMVVSKSADTAFPE